ncbi:pol, partial [Symbiodinium microadriaticum]
RNKTPRAEPPSRAVHEVAYLAGGSYVAAGLSVLAKARSRDRVSGVQLGRRRAKTKHQWQSLKRVAAAGVNVRLAAGHSVRDAYVADGRGAIVGAGLKGLHHSKALLIVSETTADLIVGSLNWSTSSKANAESGLHLAVASGAPVVADFIRDFETVFSGGSALDDAKLPVPKAAAATGSARSGPPTQTL